MEYAFVGMMIPDEMSAEFLNISKRNMQDAANALQWHIYNGLCQNLHSKITLINALPVGSYPQFCKEAFVKRSTFETKYCEYNINIDFCNIKLIRNFSQMRRIQKELERWIKSTDDAKTVFVYTASAIFLKAIRGIKKKNPEIIICDIIADLPHFSSLSSKKTYLAKWFAKYMADESYKCLDSIDYFVLLTKHMADYLKIKKTFCVMEGIATENSTLENEDANNTADEDKKIIFYSGTLHKRFGVLNLLEAFSNISNENYRLQLCGVGDCEDEIVKFARNDHRINYLGRLPRAKVLELQKRATVLVNPRQNNEEFTKYSFPSKNLEYLSSGVPMIAYKLDGIPNEYDKHIFYVEDNSIEALKSKIMEVCEMPESQRQLKGKEAQEFVSGQKNEIFQTKRIVELISKELLVPRR